MLENTTETFKAIGLNRVIAFGNIKGGVGKTFFLISYARFLVQTLHKKVLVIDLDPQHAATLNLDSGEDIKKKNIEIAIATQSIMNNIYTTAEGIDFLGSRLSLYGLRSMPIPTILNLLQTALKDEDLNYDYILLDTAGTWDNIVISAFNASNLIVCPCQLDDMQSYFIANFVRSSMQLEIPLSVDKLKILFNFVQSGTVYDEYRKLYQSDKFHMFNTEFPQSKALHRSRENKEIIKEGVKKWDGFYKLFMDFHLEIIKTLEERGL